MRNALVVVGIGALVIIIGIYVIKIKNVSSPDGGLFMSSLSLTSSAFGNGASMPSHFTCDGANSSPGLSISGVPEGAKSLALTMEDPDVPKVLRPDGVFDHWVLFNISPTTTEIPEGGTVGTEGRNGVGNNRYTGPCPPSQYEPSEHRYIFKLYALDTELPLTEKASKADVLKAMEGHIIGKTELMGKYKRVVQ